MRALGDRLLVLALVGAVIAPAAIGREGVVDKVLTTAVSLVSVMVGRHVAKARLLGG